MPFGYIGQNQTKQKVKNSGVLSSFEVSHLEKLGQAGGSLELIETQTISSAVASLNFTSIKGGRYDTHLFEIRNLIGSTDNKPTYLRFSNDGATSFEAGTSYEYAFDNGGYGNSTFEQHKSTGTSAIFLSNNAGNGTNETSNFYCYIYNANNSSGYTFMTKEVAELNSTPELVGQQGGGVYTQNTAINGLTYFMNSGNIDAGTFRLYGLKK